MRTLVLSLIPVRRSGDEFETDARWAKDISTQAEFQSVSLLCPFGKTSNDTAVLSSGIEVHDISKADLEQLVLKADAVQLPGNFGWRQSSHSRKLMRLAHRAGKPVFVGISSDRAKTAWMNRKSALKGLVRFFDIRTAQRFLTRRASGVFVVGSGIKRLARPNGNVHVATASWINAEDIFERPKRSRKQIRICCASRLEPMKGVENGSYATAYLSDAFKGIALDIVGEGPAREDLENAVERARLEATTRFLGQLSYPEEFLSYLRTVDYVLLTNLGDEQPRLIFDAISQGCLPICPDSTAYLSLGLDRRLFYQKGRPEAASATIAKLILLDEAERTNIERSLRTLAQEFTLESMHRRRAEWMALT